MYISRLGNDIVLEVEVIGKPKAKIEWAKGLKPIKWNTKKYTLHSDGNRHSLTIARPTDNDVGDYKITGSSSAGKNTKVFYVKQKGIKSFKVLTLYFL